MMIELPKDAAEVMARLNRAGYEAYAVGGCVRDSLLGIAPKDWDICTAASPEEMTQVFAGLHTVETGLKHGTLTVVMNHVPYEVTTFRVDGEYTDHRHPDGVTFVRNVREDLARRDFTVNAMAWSPETGLVDLFGGREDLDAGVIRCVGEPAKRFEEDALRILRAMRFAAVYDFAVEPGTAKAIHALYPTLEGVAAERIRVELAKLVCGRAAERILIQFGDVLRFVLPEAGSASALGSAAASEAVRMACLLAQSGPEGAMRAGERLRMDKATAERIRLLTANIDLPLGAQEHMLMRPLSLLGEDALYQLIEVQAVRIEAVKGQPHEAASAWKREVSASVDALLAKAPCVSIRDLAVNGTDLTHVGVPKGKKIGEYLKALLDAVMDGEVPNDRDTLLARASAWLTVGR